MRSRCLDEYLHAFFQYRKSMSDNSKWTLLEAREPLKQSGADLSNAKDTLALIHDMVVA